MWRCVLHFPHQNRSQRLMLDAIGMSFIYLCSYLAAELSVCWLLYESQQENPFLRSIRP
jgi:hypothetical protein